MNTKRIEERLDMWNRELLKAQKEGCGKYTFLSCYHVNKLVRFHNLFWRTLWSNNQKQDWLTLFKDYIKLENIGLHIYIPRIIKEYLFRNVSNLFTEEEIEGFFN